MKSQLCKQRHQNKTSVLRTGVAGVKGSEPPDRNVRGAPYSFLALRPQPPRCRAYFVAVFKLAVLAMSGLMLSVSTTLADDVRSIENSSVIVSIDGENVSIRTKADNRLVVPCLRLLREMKETKVTTRQMPVWGEAQQIDILHTDGWKTEIRVYPDHPFVHVSTIAGNPTDQPVRMRVAKLMEIQYDLGIDVENVRTLGTGGLGGASAAGSYTYAVAADPETRKGLVCGWLTHERGIGVFFPSAQDGRTSISTQVEFGQFQIEPGQSRPVETLVIGCFDDACAGLEAYADAVAKQYKIQLGPQPSVYCTWYHGGSSNEAKLAANTEFAAKHLRPFGLNVMQIDDKWQAILPKDFPYDGKIKTTGPIKVFVDTNDNYPNGMAPTAEHITSHGMIPGIWFMPFAGNFRNPYFDHEIFALNPDGTPFHDERWSGTCLDMSQPQAQKFLAERVKRIYDWGYRYFKLDGMHTGAPSKNIYVNTAYREDTFPESRLHDPKLTHVEAYRRGLQVVRQNGPEAIILGCNVSQNMVSMGPAFGLIDAMRIGPDNGGAGRGAWNSVKVGAWHGSNLYFLNGRVWHNDPDPVYVRESNPLKYAQLMCSWVAVSGSMLTTSYQFAELPPERLDLLKRTMPGPGVLGRPVDLFESDQARIWLLTDTRRNTRRDVIGLFNWEEKQPTEIVYDMGKLGLNSQATYEAFDFWDNKFLEPIQGRLQETLPAGSCRVLAVRPAADHPQLLSTSRHIAQCMVDVQEETWNASTKTLSGRSTLVADDLYEMRIILPSAGSWQVSDAKVGNFDVETTVDGNRSIRIRCTPNASGDVDWSVKF